MSRVLVLLVALMLSGSALGQGPWETEEVIPIRVAQLLKELLDGVGVDVDIGAGRGGIDVQGGINVQSPSVEIDVDISVGPPIIDHGRGRQQRRIEGRLESLDSRAKRMLLTECEKVLASPAAFSARELGVDLVWLCRIAKGKLGL